MKIGEILLNRKQITIDQLEQAMEIQRTTRQLLGKILIDCHFLSNEDVLERSLQEQYWRSQQKWIIN